MIVNRTAYEELEHKILSPSASFSDRSLGRKYEEAEDDYRTIFQRDRDRIIHSKAFRRLKHKTQVFLSPEGDHYRTRLTHTLEVSQIARSIARALRLNEDLTEAITLAHDLGHTPFGHCGERALDQVHPGGFDHSQQSVRVVEFLERRPTKPFYGLNLSYEVLNGIANHSGKRQAATLEGQICKFADRIAYINHDIDDAIRAGILTNEQIDQELIAVLGDTSSKRLKTMIQDVIVSSSQSDQITMSPLIGQAMLDLREFLFDHLYYNPLAKGEEIRAERLVQLLYEFFRDSPDQMSPEFFSDYQTHGIESVKDYIAGMTDRYAINRFKELMIPRFWQ